MIYTLDGTEREGTGLMQWRGEKGGTKGDVDREGVGKVRFERERKSS